MVTSLGINALYNPGYAYSSYGYYPSAWSAPVYDSWGISSVANDWMYSGYANPYATPATQVVYVQQPQPATVVVENGASTPAAQQVVAYDYSQPIDTSAPPSDASVAETAQKIFESARGLFKAGDFGGALSLTDQALAQLKTDPVLHEFRALTLFALKRFDEAAAVNYAVLSAGPAWDWPTMIGLFPSIDVYTAQLRALEQYAEQHPDSAAAQFLLGYFYMVQDAREAAAKRFARVAKLQPADTLSAQLAKALDPSQEQKLVQQTLTAAAPPAAPATAASTPASGAPSQTEPPPAPPAEMAGTWLAAPDPKVKISLVLQPEGGFSWAVTQNGRTETIQGRAGYKDGVLVLSQAQGPPLTGKISFDAEKKSFSFKPPAPRTAASGLAFTREQSS